MSLPALRFKQDDGRDFPTWESKAIGDVLSIGSGKDYKHLNSGNIPVYGTGGYMLSVDSFLYDGESVCIGRKGTIDKPVLLNGKFWTVDTLFYTHSFKNCIPRFIYATFQRIDWKNYNEASGVPSLSKSTIEKIVISLPSTSEQTRIANFLTAVDEKINQLTQKHGLLNQYKKGVMKQIFSQELRFKDDDGADFPEWEETTLGDICKPQQWKTIAASELTEFGYPAYGANGQIGFYSDYNHEDETVAVTCRGATCGEVSLIPPRSYITGNAMSLDEVNPKDNNHRFVYYALILRGFRDVISGSAQPQIVGSAIRKVDLAKPVIKEQTKIANFLTAIDDKITAVQSQLQAAKQYKQGLLQQMFV